MEYANRTPDEFNKYDALEMLETFQNTAGRDNNLERKEYYRLACQSARSKINERINVKPEGGEAGQKGGI